MKTPKALPEEVNQRFEEARENGWFTSMGELDVEFSKSFLAQALADQQQRFRERLLAKRITPDSSKTLHQQGLSLDYQERNKVLDELLSELEQGE